MHMRANDFQSLDITDMIYQSKTVNDQWSSFPFRAVLFFVSV